MSSDNQENTNTEAPVAAAESNASAEASVATAVEVAAAAPHEHGASVPAQRQSASHEIANGDGELYGVLAEFDTPGELIAAARKVRSHGYSQFDCYSPFPVHGIDDAMGIKRTILPVLVFGGGVAGVLLGTLLQWWTNAYNWPWNISGKPAWSIPANVAISYESGILLAVFTTFFGMWGLNKLPQVWHPFFRLDRFARATDDALLLGIEAKDPKFDLAATTKLLEGAGALAVDPCYLDADPVKKQMPKFIYGIVVVTTVLALIPIALVARARNSKSKSPHIHVFADMDFQPKVKSDSANDLFADGRGNRGMVNGTVARGQLAADGELARGVTRIAATATEPAHDAWVTGLPASIDANAAFVKRGQQRYNIYCAPCHGFDGRGEGVIPKRAAAAKAGAMNPANLVAAKGTAVAMPNGQLFNTISNGFNTMMGYAAQITPRDRWAIVLYVRALQRSQFASLEDVPADRRGDAR